MPLKLGACFPSRDIGTDVGAIRAFAEGVEALGYTQLSMYDHVLGADTTNRPDWDFSLFPYTIKDNSPRAAYPPGLPGGGDPTGHPPVLGHRGGATADRPPRQAGR